MTGTSTSRTMSGTARAAASLLTVTRTSSLPAACRARTWATVAGTSAVSVLVIDCTTMGRSPPTPTPPTSTGTAFRRFGPITRSLLVGGRERPGQVCPALLAHRGTRLPPIRAGEHHPVRVAAAQLIGDGVLDGIASRRHIGSGEEEQGRPGPHLEQVGHVPRRQDGVDHLFEELDRTSQLALDRGQDGSLREVLLGEGRAQRPGHPCRHMLERAIVPVAHPLHP